MEPLVSSRPFSPSRCLKILVVCLSLALTAVNVWAAGNPLYAGFPALETSEAFKQYQLRPKSDLSKLVYLIDRFAQSKVEIIYEGLHVPAPPAAAVAKWFLARNYKKQTPSQWIYQWCNTTIPNSRLILVKLPDGKTVPGRTVLFNELAALEAAEKETAKRTPAA